MKLFLVVYLNGVLGGWAGPLPYGIEECTARAEVFQAEDDARDGPLLFRCEWRSDINRPVRSL